jgi:hypothetical protein
LNRKGKEKRRTWTKSDGGYTMIELETLEKEVKKTEKRLKRIDTIFSALISLAIVASVTIMAFNMMK